MSILINGTVDFEPADAEKAVAAAADLMAKTRTQAGCRHYVWSLDPAVPGRVYVYENWESEQALADHLAGRYYREMLGLLSGFGIKASETLKYLIETAGPIYDDTGTPRADFFATVDA